MDALRYKPIRSKFQQRQYLVKLQELVIRRNKAVANREKKDLTDEIGLLCILLVDYEGPEPDIIQKYFDGNPIALVRQLMQERNIKAKDLVQALGVSKSLVSDILHEKKGLSKIHIKRLADYLQIDADFLFDKRLK